MRPLHYCYVYHYSYGSPGSAPALLAILLLSSFSLITQEITGLQDSPSSSSSRLQIQEVEVEALLEFKTNYISKDSQHVLWSWNSSSTGMVCESWAGISCTNMSGTHHQLRRVSDIRLPSHGLRGSLAPELGNLSLLTALDLSNNSFTGNIPSQLQGCTSLTLLNLNGNRLTRAIPSELGFLSHLQILDLGHNQLTGAIPPSLAMCTNLTQLILAYNQLTGPVPAELSQLPLGRQNYMFKGGRAEMSLDLSHNQLSGSLPVSLGQLVWAQIIDLSNNNFVGSIPESWSQLVLLVSLDLSNNYFVGGIPQSLYACACLYTLSLANNHLSGDLQFQLVSPTNLVFLDLSNNNFWGGLQFLLRTDSNLHSLNVSFNNLTGVIPTNGLFAHLNANSFQGNPGLCGPILKRECPYYVPLSQPKKRSGLLHSGSLLITFFGIILPSILMMWMLTAVWHYCLVRRGKVTCKIVTCEMQFIGKLAGAKRYSAQELMEATQAYSDHNLLGQGGHSVVYKGVLPDGKIVAVKKMNDVYNGSPEVLLKEMQILSKLRHRNLVQVLGCVLNLDVKALVLEYMANGTLEWYLDMRQVEHPPDVMETEMEYLSHWEMIIRVATSVAKALAYLHHDYDVPIIHGDVKPSNILLDSDMEPHLADFGLAKRLDGGAEAISITSEFQGSIGYMAPEYALAARITTKVDVYAYGVVLLRMLTGRRPTQVNIPGGFSTLHEWVKSKLPNSPSMKEDCGRLANVKEVLDVSLLQRISNSPAHNNMNGSSTCSSTSSSHGFDVVSLLQMGLACTMDCPSDRPTIQQVLGLLQRHQDRSYNDL